MADDMRLIVQPIDYGIPNNLIAEVDSLTSQKGSVNMNLLVQYFNQAVQELNKFGFRFPKITQDTPEAKAKGYWTVNMPYKPLPEPYFTDYFVNSLLCKTFIKKMMTDEPNFQLLNAQKEEALNRIIVDSMYIDDSYKISVIKSIELPTSYRSRY